MVRIAVLGSGAVVTGTIVISRGVLAGGFVGVVLAVVVFWHFERLEEVDLGGLEMRWIGDGVAGADGRGDGGWRMDGWGREINRCWVINTVR
jgi:hypothetical protein